MTLPCVIERYDPARHDRIGFSSGVLAVDNYFHQTAGKHDRAGNVRLFLMVTAAEGHIVGYFTLNAHSIDHAELPPRFARTRPGHGRIPAAYIGMLGIDRRFQGRGLGGVLLAEALRRVAEAQERMGIAVVALDILDDDAEAVARRRALNQRYGFQSLPSRSLRMFLPVAAIRSLMG